MNINESFNCLCDSEEHAVHDEATLAHGQGLDDMYIPVASHLLWHGARRQFKAHFPTDCSDGL
ncbi:MAG: hypothetical protein IPK00_24265 [Deltaproteobacteria bacterium]|nr:hypothetical protein [Deltaproteobacteria bacterium]